MGVDGSAWWVPILGVSSLILRELSSTLNWRLSIFSSSKGLLPSVHDVKAVFGCKEFRQKTRKKCTALFHVLFVKIVWLVEKKKHKG